MRKDQVQILCEGVKLSNITFKIKKILKQGLLGALNGLHRASQAKIFCQTLVISFIINRSVPFFKC